MPRSPAQIAETDRVRAEFIEYLKTLGPEDGCVYAPWSKQRKTYAVLKINGQTTRASRWVYEQVVGPLPPRPRVRGASGILVCHTCDNPPCLNPFHLFLADNKGNQHDMAVKGHRKGVLNGRAKIDEDDVRLILKLVKQGVQQRKIARAFGLGQSQVSRIVRGETWPTVEREGV